MSIASARSGRRSSYAAAMVPPRARARATAHGSRVGIAGAAAVLGLLVTSCTPVHGPSHIFSVRATAAGDVEVLVTGCPDGWGATEELALRHAGQDQAVWTIRSERGPYEDTFVLGQVSEGYEAYDDFPGLEADERYVVGEWQNGASFRLDQLRSDRLWNGEEYVDEAGQLERCAELLAAAERRDRILTSTILFGIPATFVVAMGLIVWAVVAADRRRQREARVMATGMPPNPNWPVR